MNNKTRFLFFLFFLSGSVSLRADQIELSEGNVVYGKITYENGDEVMIRTAPNMYLKIKQEDIVRIKRTGRPAETRSSAAASSASPETVKASVSNPAPAVKAPPVPDDLPFSPVKRVAVGVSVANKTIDRVSIRRVVDQRARLVSGKSFEEVSSRKDFRPSSVLAFNRSWTGSVDHEKGRARWKSAVIRSTVTVLTVDWEAPLTVDNESIKQWDRFISDAAAQDAERIAINNEALQSFAHSLLDLRAEDEKTLRAQSDDLFEVMESQVQRKMDGFDRRNAPERKNWVEKKKNAEKKSK